MLPAVKLGLLAATLLLVAAPGSCGPGNRGPSDNRPPNRPNVNPAAVKGCDVDVIEPQLSPFENVIEANVLAVCDVVPIEHIIHVAIEHQTGAGWAPVIGINLAPYMECTDLPTPAAPVLCVQASPCLSDGRYRTSVTILGVDELGPFTWSPHELPESVIQCWDDEDAADA